MEKNLKPGFLSESNQNYCKLKLNVQSSLRSGFIIKKKKKNETAIQLTKQLD